MTLLKLSKLLFCRASLWRRLLLWDKNRRYYEHCIKQTAPRHLISDRDLYETSKRAALMGQTLLVRRTPFPSVLNTIRKLQISTLFVHVLNMFTCSWPDFHNWNDFLRVFNKQAEFRYIFNYVHFKVKLHGCFQKRAIS